MSKNKRKMLIKTTLDYSINFNPKKRQKKQIKFLIFHYTGMKNKNLALKKLKNIQSKVSSHYFITCSGEIITLVPNLYIAWHAGISSWKNYTSLNKNSIGIEIENPGHGKNYKNFSKNQIKSTIKLSKFLMKKFNIKKKNILGHSDISPDRKKDPGEKFPWQYLSKKNIGIWHKIKTVKLKKLRGKRINENKKNSFLFNLHKLGYSKNINHEPFNTRAFQRHFRPELINGKIDEECLVISKNLILI